MPNSRAAVDPAIHDAAARCARRCVEIIASLLRPEEVGEAVREFQAAITEELEANKRGKDRAASSQDVD